MSAADGKRCNLLHRKSLEVFHMVVESDAEIDESKGCRAAVFAPVCIWCIQQKGDGNFDNGALDEACEKALS